MAGISNRLVFGVVFSDSQWIILSKSTLLLKRALSLITILKLYLVLDKNLLMVL